MLLLMLACEAQPIVQGDPVPAPAPAVVTIYSGRSEALVGPLFERAEAELGLDLQIQYGDTPELVTRLLAEGAESPADLILAQDSGHLGALSQRAAIAPLPQALLDQVDPAYRDPDGRWIGTSGRLRVVVVNASVPVADRPSSLKDLADPRWKGQLGWAPSNGSFQCHVSALRALWGEDETRAWLTAVQANEPTVYPKNSPQVEAAHAGEIQVGWVNHYYLHQKKTEGYQALNHSLAPGDAGNIMMVSGAAVRSGSPNAAAAERVLGWLVSEPAQASFAQDNFEYPTRPGVPTHPDVPAIDPSTLAEVSQAALADVGPTRAMLQELGLQ